MQDKLEDLSNTLLSIYQKNLLFLKENYEDIFNRVDTLSQDINNNNYKEKYSLEYKDGYFDILNLEDNTWYYGTNTYEDADNRSKECDFTKNGSYNLLRTLGDSNYIAKAESYKDVTPIVDFINEKVDLDNVKFDKIFKMIFIGSGLGIHIHEINKKLNSMNTLIIEPELEVFRLSLFITDYSEFSLNNKTLFLCIDEDELKRKNIYRKFYLYHVYMNYSIKKIILLNDGNKYDNELTDFFSNNFSGYFPYKLVLENIKKSINFMKNGEYFIDTNMMMKNNILNNKKVLVIAAGPSLDNYIDLIKVNQDKFIIICVDVIVKKLELHNIVPNIVVSIDPSELCAGYLSCNDNNYLNNSLIVLLAQQDDKTIEILKGKNYIFSQSINVFNEIGTLGSVSNVGTFSYLIAAHFGSKEIYTIGTDCAFNQDTGSRYAKDSSYEIFDKTTSNDSSIISSKDVIEVKGNLRDVVKTNRELYNFKSTFEMAGYDLNNTYDGIKTYNLSDGAFINIFSPMTMDDFKNVIKNTKSVNFNVKEEKKLIARKIENIDYTSDIKILTRLINKTSKNKSISIKNKDNFLERKLDLMIYILEESKKMSSTVYGDIFLLYTELVDIYINFVLNLKQKDLHLKNNLQQININWSNGIINVLKDLKEVINK